MLERALPESSSRVASQSCQFVQGSTWYLARQHVFYLLVNLVMFCRSLGVRVVVWARGRRAATGRATLLLRSSREAASHGASRAQSWSSW